MPSPSLKPLLRDIGLATCPRFYRDGQFYLALLAGAVVALGLYLLFGPPPRVPPPLVVWLMVVLVWPLVEELVFRGLLQGELLRTRWGPRAVAGVTAANLVTTLVFVGFHFIHHPPLWAALVIFPSLVFGYFRDRHGSVYPALVLHVLYNFGYLLAVY